MKITKFDIKCANVEMAPHRTASGVITVSPVVLLTVHTDAGVQGHSITFTYSPSALKPTGDLMRNLEPLVVGQALAPAAQADVLAGRFKLLGTQGLVGMVLAGIDMALWDAFARSQDLPLTKLIGGDPRPIPAYGGVGYDGVQGSAQAAEAWAKQGLKGVKAKIGYPTVEQDVDVIRAIKSAVGPGVAVMVDYNQSLNATEARKRLKVLEAEGLTWIEEPVLAHDYRAFVELAQATETPLQAGENWWGPLDFRHAFEAGIRDHCMPDVMKVGGVTGWMRVAALAQTLGVPVSNHLWPEISAQLLMATPTAAWLEYADWWNPVLQQPLTLKDGYAVISEEVRGTGVEFDPKSIAKFEA